MSDIPLDRTMEEDIRPSSTTPEPETSLQDDVRAALEAVKTAPEGETQDQRAARAAQMARDASGKFTKDKTQTEARPRGTLTLPADKAAAAQPQAAQTPAQEGVTPQAPVAVKPPEGWKAELKAKFGELPPDIQAEIARRESDFHKQFTRQDEERSFGRTVKEIAQPYEHIIAGEGGKVTDAWKLYLDTAYTMRTGTPEAKAYGIATVMRQFNVDPNLLLSVLQRGNVDPSGALQHAPNYAQQPPSVQPQQVQELVQAEIQNWQLRSEIDRFEASDPKFYRIVKPIMGDLLLKGEAQTLEEAHQKAIDQFPELRSILEAEQNAEAEQKRQAETQARTQAARRAGGSLTGGPGGAKPNGSTMPGNLSLEDEVRANFRAAMGRV